MPEGYYFCIPSYKRAHRQKTLELLEKIGTPKETIIMSVQTDDDRKEYAEAGVNQRVGTILYREGKCAADNRNTLLDHFQRGSKIILLEDDINRICRLRIDEITGKHSLVNVETYDELLHICKRGFLAAAKEKTVAFGLNMYRNATFMKKGYDRKKLCDTGFFGMIVTDLRFDSRLKVYDDPDMCARIIKRYGAFVSIEDYCCVIDRITQGGCYDLWTAKGTKINGLAEIKKRHADIFNVVMDESCTNPITLKKEPRGKRSTRSDQ